MGTILLETQRGYIEEYGYPMEEIAKLMRDVYIIKVISVLTFIMFVIYLIFQLRKTCKMISFSKPIKLSMSICFSCWLGCSCYSFPAFTEAIEEAQNKFACKLESSLRTSTLLLDGMLCFLNSIYIYNSFLNPAFLEQNEGKFNIMLYCVPIVCILNLIFGYFTFKPRVSIIGSCKMKYYYEPIALTELSVVYVFGYVGVIIFIILYYKLNKQKFFEKDKNSDNGNDRVDVLGFYRKRLKLLIVAQGIRNLLYFGACVHLPYLKIWISTLLEYLGTLTFPFEIFLFGYLQTNIFLDCCSQQQSAASQSKEIALIGQLEDEEEEEE